jgi:hypothetical protein
MNENLLTKAELAEKLGLTIRGVECLMAKKKIPVLRISSRCVRFCLPKVEAALDAYEVKAVSR